MGATGMFSGGGDVITIRFKKHSKRTSPSTASKRTSLGAAPDESREALAHLAWLYLK
jgi:hypothetical protein